jgi:sigma-B regulation protein RsbU (phosphoserine phosphatase)
MSEHGPFPSDAATRREPHITQTAIPSQPVSEDLNAGDPNAFEKLVALIVDDSSAQRKMLKVMLRKWNFEVIEAEDGMSALGLAQSRHIDFIISDWMMPGISGPDLCREIRALDQKNYIYFMLLTSKKSKEEVAAGLDAGADDFLSKPVDLGEMQARLRAGQRLLTMQDDLVDKNTRITEAFDRLNAIYQSIDRDLKAAARLQKALIPERQTHCGPVKIGRIYQPSHHVGGDLIGFFKLSDSRIAAYAIDVSGHGVSSALMTARLSNFFNPQHLDENIAIRRLPNGEYAPRDPAAITAELNDRLQDEADNDQYFTMIFADINLDSGMTRFCQAGQPHPAIIRNTGEIEFAGTGGAPVGLIPDMEYETSVVQLDSGDRFMMYSDGITECEDPDGNMLEEEGLSAFLKRNRGYGEHETLERVMKELVAFTGSSKFDDDISALLLTIP